MRLDIRLPIGALFTIIGIVLVAYGIFADTSIYAKSLGLNVNLWWGLALLVFGGIFTFYGTRRRPLEDPSARTD